MMQIIDCVITLFYELCDCCVHPTYKVFGTILLEISNIDPKN